VAQQPGGHGDGGRLGRRPGAGRAPQLIIRPVADGRWRREDVRPYPSPDWLVEAGYEFYEEAHMNMGEKVKDVGATR